MAQLLFEEPVTISGLILVYISSVLLWGMYGCYPLQYPPWPFAPMGVLDNILTNALFLGISLLIASFILQQVEVQRIRSTTNALCGALAHLTVLTFMRIVEVDMELQPSMEDDDLWNLFLWGCEADAGDHMYNVAQRYSDSMNDDNFKDAIFRGELDISPRIERYCRDTASLRRDIRSILIPLTINALNDKDTVMKLGRYASFCSSFEQNIVNAMYNKDYVTVANENILFLECTKQIYHVLKGKRSLHPIGALYGHEDPAEICI